MDQFVKEKLREDEEVLWEGRPQNVQLLEKAYKNNLFTRWAMSILAVIVAGAYAVYGIGKEFETSSIVLVCSLIVIGALGSAIAPFFMKGNLEKNYYYFITSQRFIAYKAGLNPRIDWREIDDVKEATIEMIDANTGNIFIGPKNKAAYKNLRIDICPNYNEEYKNQTLPFCSVGHPMDAYDAFPKSIKVERIKAAK